MLRMAHSLSTVHALFPRGGAELHVVHSALLICLAGNNTRTNMLHSPSAPPPPHEEHLLFFHFFQARQLKKTTAHELSPCIL